ncbi:MAG: 50S ribosomal protein L25 [Rhodothermales bacterium]|nr:50S ribosomal protein L25 [Rhodothermales bacterium]MBO6780921.1 50S ribosomal protein L25 [Rhodothermales bacterium]
MDVIKLDAKTREAGKGAARAARRNEEVPCILYGHSQEPVAFQVGELDLRPLIYTDEFHRVEVAVSGNTYDCILKHVDFHPVSDRPMHADFQVLQAGEKITLTVPLQLVGTSLGQRNGGRPVQRFNELEVTCLPKDIPDHFSIDVTDIDVGDTIHLEILEDEKFEFGLPMNSTLFFVQAARAEVEEEEDDLMGDTMAEAGEEAPSAEGDDAEE